MEKSGESTAAAAAVKLKPIEATAETFGEFGQVIEASADGEEFGPQDAQLDLSRGIPRFYIMHLNNRPLKFSSITYHASVTQCLGSIGGNVWYLGVSKPSIVDSSEINADEGLNVVKSHCGHFYVPPAVNDVCVFRVSGPKFLKLNRGTWHAGPLFNAASMDFYNLELSNTNVSTSIPYSPLSFVSIFCSLTSLDFPSGPFGMFAVADHTLHDFKKKDGVVFLIDE
ncbi:hypothetical protein RHGRI_013797 [Rhododendron griersonianum]|uniref:Ureidoglycolate hydrolase n=1 Tax=Rhododendron griersonianum TaxID=479676 RepID=A0AAV6K717_9ERIC|nr:hypothetical protein RHGRI_013797 [Rhododendron griersonianum]